MKVTFNQIAVAETIESRFGDENPMFADRAMMAAMPLSSVSAEDAYFENCGMPYLELVSYPADVKGTTNHIDTVHCIGWRFVGSLRVPYEYRLIRACTTPRKSNNTNQIGTRS